MLSIPGLERLDKYEGNYNYTSNNELISKNNNASSLPKKNFDLETLDIENNRYEKKRQRNVLQFEWNNNEDTTRFESNELYKNRLDIEKLIQKRIRKDDRSVEFDKDNEKTLKNLNYDDMTERDWKIFREDYSINVKGLNIPNPIRNWEDCIYLGVNKDIMRNIRFESPTAIQMQCIPIGLEMRDMIGIAETGSGKTIAFLIPLINYVSKLPRLNYNNCQDGPYGLILVPARELAIQIEGEIQKLCLKGSNINNIRTLSIVGGRNIEQQAFSLHKGIEIIIATPGRMQDCLEKSLIVLSRCFYVILDEADRMVDLGFNDSLNYILDHIPVTQKRITHMFSATMQEELEQIAKKYLDSPINVSIGEIGGGKKSIQQILNFITENKKKSTLINTLNNKELAIPPIMIFLNQKKMVDVVCREIISHGFKATSLHGGKIQEMRENNLNQFKNGIYDILVSTDVAGRGIDIANVNLVINYDLPKTIDTYNHRIGRTGRAGKTGVAISFVTPEDSDLYSDLKKYLISTDNIVPNELKNCT